MPEEPWDFRNKTSQQVIDTLYFSKNVLDIQESEWLTHLAHVKAIQEQTDALYWINTHADIVHQ